MALNEADFSDFREEGALPVDHPGRKLAIYANPAGQVVLLSSESGLPIQYTVLEPEEVTAVCSALLRAATEAKALAENVQAEYQTFLAIENAKEAVRARGA
jgi:hypothetical protein